MQEARQQAAAGRHGQSANAPPLAPHLPAMSGPAACNPQYAPSAVTGSSRPHASVHHHPPAMVAPPQQAPTTHSRTPPGHAYSYGPSHIMHPMHAPGSLQASHPMHVSANPYPPQNPAQPWLNAQGPPQVSHAAALRSGPSLPPTSVNFSQNNGHYQQGNAGGAQQRSARGAQQTAHVGAPHPTAVPHRPPHLQNPSGPFPQQSSPFASASVQQYDPHRPNASNDGWGRQMAPNPATANTHHPASAAPQQCAKQTSINAFNASPYAPISGFGDGYRAQAQTAFNNCTTPVMQNHPSQHDGMQFQGSSNNFNVHDKPQFVAPVPQYNTGPNQQHQMMRTNAPPVQYSNVPQGHANGMLPNGQNNQQAASFNGPHPQHIPPHRQQPQQPVHLHPQQAAYDQTGNYMQAAPFPKSSHGIQPFPHPHDTPAMHFDHGVPPLHPPSGVGGPHPQHAVGMGQPVQGPPQWGHGDCAFQQPVPHGSRAMPEESAFQADFTLDDLRQAGLLEDAPQQPGTAPHTHLTAGKLHLTAFSNAANIFKF